MIAGIDRYLQICRCFRDEDLRADRQPEFTQIDVEMSFATEDLVYGVVEGAIQAMFAAAGIEVETPFPRISYDEAMLRYGSDKPDLRPGMPIADVSAAFAESPFARVPRRRRRRRRRARLRRRRRGASTRARSSTI